MHSASKPQPQREHEEQAGSESGTEQQLKAGNRLLQALAEAQTDFIRGCDTHQLFSRLLEVLLDLTGSEYGFIGEVLHSPEGDPYLRTHAITNIAWTEELREHYALNAPLGMEFRNLRTLFGAVLTSGEAVLTNEPEKDARSGGIPHGHPPLKAFLGLPFKSGGVLVGMVGIANRPVGYGPDVIEFLQPLLTTCCSVILGWRSEQQRRHVEKMLRSREEELQRHREHLEELVNVRTEKLLRTTRELEEQQAQLIQAEKLASLGQIAAGIAHEINNPMSYVMSNLSTLTQYVSALKGLLQLYDELEQAVGEEPRGRVAEVLSRIRELRRREDLGFILGDVNELLEDSRQGSQRVKDIVQSLRMFIRDEAGQSPEVVDVNRELATSLKMMKNELKDRCEVHCDYGQVLPILGYPTQLNQVFTNLLSNAAQAIEERGEVRISSFQEGDMVVVEISDTGHGMSPEVQARLFTPFFTTKQPGKGTGLGLSISYGIISRHQGRIDVRSQPGQGTTFTLRLPVMQESEGEA